MSPRSEQLRAKLREAVVALCQEESFYHKELRIEGTLCIVSDQASVLITQISEQIGEVIIKQENHELPQLDPEQRQALVYNSVSQPHYMIPGTKRVLSTVTNPDQLQVKRQYLEHEKKNVNNLSATKVACVQTTPWVEYKPIEDTAVTTVTTYPTEVNSQKTAMLEQASLTYQSFEATADQDSSLSQLDESSMQDLPEIIKVNKKFQCPLCDKSYAFKHSAKAHLSTHNKNLRHCCKLCNAKFAYASSLSSHTKKHHPETMSKEYQCDICRQICVNLSSLKQHYTWRHKDVKFPASYEIVEDSNSRPHQVTAGGTTFVVAPLADTTTNANEHGVMQVQGVRFPGQADLSQEGITVQPVHPQHLQTTTHPTIITSTGIPAIITSLPSSIPPTSTTIVPSSATISVVTPITTTASAAHTPIPVVQPVSGSGVAVATMVAASSGGTVSGAVTGVTGGGGGGGVTAAGGDDALDILQQVIQRYSDDSGTQVHQQFHHTMASGTTLQHHPGIPLLPGQTTIQPTQLLAPLQTSQHQIHLTTTSSTQPTTLQQHHHHTAHHQQQQPQQHHQVQLQQQGLNSAITLTTATPSAKEKPVIADYFDEVNIQTQHGTYKYQCKTCRNMFKSRHALYEHINTHLGRKPYSCDICGQTFAHHSTLYNHKRNKHTYATKEEKEAGFKFKCPTCEKRFEFPSALDRHFAKFPEHSVSHENAEAAATLQQQQQQQQKQQQQHHHHHHELQQHLVTASQEQDDSHQDSNIEEDEEEENME